MYPQNAMARARRAYADAPAARSPAMLLVQVHDGMVDKLVDARTAILEGRIEDRLRATEKVAAVIEVLHLALDEQAGGEIAHNLGRLYGYFATRLQAINVANDAAICDELIARLRELRRGWAAHIDAGPTAAIDGALVSA